MSAPFRAACVQSSSARDIEANLPIVREAVLRAHEGGANFIFLPENVSMLEPVARLLREKARPEDTHPALPFFRHTAREISTWILVGSLAIRVEEGKVANRSYLIDAQGNIVARYDKVHLFDVDLSPGESYRESATIAPGNSAVIADTPWGRVGMSVCYDVRFPGLYRHLARSGADFLTIPSAFTRTTGAAHWHVLVRARAIENGCYVFAPAQCGTHAEGRQTFGHSLIVDPWGTVLADGGDDIGIIFADIDPREVAAARRRVPALNHERPFT